MKQWMWVLGLSAAAAGAAGAARADDLCKVNPYTPAEATAGKVLFDSHCALCHQYSMAGRTPGNWKNETPDIATLSEGDLGFLDNAGGVVPPLVGEKFFRKQADKSLAEFSAFVSSAANSFPPTGKVDMPLTYLKIAAYVLYRNCGRL